MILAEKRYHCHTNAFQWVIKVGVLKKSRYSEMTSCDDLDCRLRGAIHNRYSSNIRDGILFFFAWYWIPAPSSSQMAVTVTESD